MNEFEIYSRLVQHGMTPESAAGMMGNFRAESGMIANNVEDRMHRILNMTDAAYTAAVDGGRYVKFATDGFGYGLYQLTHPGRKAGYLSFARSRGVSIGDAMTQVDYAVLELQRDFPALWAWLKTNRGVTPAADRICREFERPAVNNVSERADFANEYYLLFSDVAVPETGTVPRPETSPTAEKYWPPRVLQIGMYGPDVVALQGLLIAHGCPAGTSGSFDAATDAQLRAFQGIHGLKADGIAGNKSWTELTRR